MAPAQEKQSNGSTVHVDSDEYPPGYKFHPLDEELVYHYLVDYVNSRESHNQIPVESRPTRKRRHIIPEVDIYKSENPNIIKEKFPLGATSNKYEWYFFTPLSRRYPKGGRPSRTCGNNAGFWKPTGKDKDIIVRGVSAKRKCLEYLRGKPPGRKTDWKMHEYKLDDQESQDKSKKLCPALCRIYLNTRKKDKNDDDQDVQESDVAVADEKGEKQFGSDTGSNKSPAEGEVAVKNQVIFSSHGNENENATANEVAVDDPNEYETYDFGWVDSFLNGGENPPENCSPFFAYDPTFPPQM